MPASVAKHRSYTISVRVLTQNPPPGHHHHNQQQQPSTITSIIPTANTATVPPKRPSHKPTKSTPNLAVIMQSTEAFPTLLAAKMEGTTSLPQHNRDLTMRRYLLLQEEHEFIHRHLDTLSSIASSTATTAASPTRGHNRTDSAARRASMPQYDALARPRFHRRRGGDESPGAAGAAMDPSTLAEVLSEEARLFAINEGIKRSLTELLNCETVRSDQAFRQWIMARLLEVEKELRSGRRRRSCPTTE